MESLVNETQTVAMGHLDMLFELCLLCSTASCSPLIQGFARTNAVFHYIHCAFLIHWKPLMVGAALSHDTRTCHHEISL